MSRQTDLVELEAAIEAAREVARAEGRATARAETKVSRRTSVAAICFGLFGAAVGVLGFNQAQQSEDAATRYNNERIWTGCVQRAEGRDGVRTYAQGQHDLIESILDQGQEIGPAIRFALDQNDENLARTLTDLLPAYDPADCGPKPESLP